MSQGGSVPFKPIANMRFNQHGGRRGVRSAGSLAHKIIKRQNKGATNDFVENTGKGIRPGPRGMGIKTPHKPTQIVSSFEKPAFSHLHMIHEKYNER